MRRFAIVSLSMLLLLCPVQAGADWNVPPARNGQVELVFESLDESREDLLPSITAWRDGSPGRAGELLLEYFRGRDNARWFFSRRDRDRLTRAYRELFPGAAERQVELADSILAGKWHWYDEYRDCGYPPRWEEDKVDVEYTWQLNRLDQFTTLGRAYWLTGDSRYARAFARLTVDWVDNIRPPAGDESYPPWRELEVGIRARQWVNGWQFFADSPEFTSDLMIRILSTVVEHKRFLHENSPLFTSGAAHSNHFTMHSEGMLYLALMFPEFAAAEDDYEAARRGLEKCSEQQVLADGVHIEQTPDYHRGSIFWFGRPLHLAAINGHEFSGDYSERTRRMFEFLAHITRPTGALAPIGDSDPDRANAAFSFGRILFPEAVTPQGMEMDAEEARRLTFWLNNARLPAGVVSPMDTGLHAEFPDGGFFCSRTSWEPDALYLALRNGSGTPESSWHRQADHLSIDVTAYGTPLIIDPGRYTYSRNDWRRYFKETINHNTICVDRRSSVPLDEHLRWASVVETGYTGFRTDANGLSVSVWHEGFAPSRAERGVTLVEDRFWIVEDRVEPAAGSEVTVSYFFPSTEVSLLEGDYSGAALDVSEKRASIAVVQIDGRSAAKLEGGWFSERYLQRRPNLILRFSRDVAEQTYRSAHLLIPFPAGEEQRWSVEPAGDGKYRVRIMGADPVDRVIELRGE